MFKKMFIMCFISCLILTSNVYAYDEAEAEYNEELENELKEEQAYQEKCEDVYKVALVTHAEAGNQDLEGKILVASVIENRWFEGI